MIKAATPYDNKEFRQSELNPAIRRHIKAIEQDLDRTCRKTWSFVNPKGELYLFGSFCRNYDRLFVTIGYHMHGVNGGFVPQR